MISYFEPPCKKIVFDIQSELKDRPYSPEHTNVNTYTARKKAPIYELLSVENTDQCESNDRKNDITTIDPVHLAVKRRQRLKSVRHLRLEGTIAEAMRTPMCMIPPATTRFESLA